MHISLREYCVHHARPELLLQWHPTKNGELIPDTAAYGSNKKVWWQCEKGHAWQATVSSRTQRNRGCPYCAGLRILKGFNDLQTKEPLIAAQWHPTLNGELGPDMVTAGSRKRVYWICADEHVWQARISSRTGPGKHGCPVCSGRYKLKTPKITLGK